MIELFEVPKGPLPDRWVEGRIANLKSTRRIPPITLEREYPVYRLRTDGLPNQYPWPKFIGGGFLVPYDGRDPDAVRHLLHGAAHNRKKTIAHRGEDFITRKTKEGALLIRV